MTTRTPAAGPAGPGAPASPRPPAGRYGRFGDDRRADRRLRIAAVVCGVLFLALVAWLSASYLMRSSISGEVPTFRVLSDTVVQAHLSVSKRAGASGVCTLRSRAADGRVVGMLDVRVPAAGTEVERTVTIRTTSRGTTAELLGCTSDR